MKATAIQIRWKVGDLVRVRTGKRVFRISEIDPLGEGYPPPPSTYLVRIKSIDPPEGFSAVYGDQALEQVT